jgi:hypothetical protein
MGKTKSSNSSSSISSNTNHNLFISTASSFNTHQLPTDLSLGLTISSTQHFHNSLFVKVYMEGIPIGRKLNILAHQSYHELVKTLEHMFDTTILCKVLLKISLNFCDFLFIFNYCVFVTTYNQLLTNFNKQGEMRWMKCKQRDVMC